MADHKIGKTRNNQYGSWTSCARCGLRTMYKPKEGQTGQHRQAGPDLHVINLATEELKQTMSPDQCTEKVMNGKLMEVKGKLLQMGIDQTMAVNLTFKQYQEKVEKGMRGSKSNSTSQPLTPSVPIAPGVMTTAVTGRNWELEAENNELRMRLQQAEAAATALAQQAKAKATPVKKEISPKAASAAASNDGTVVTIPSSDEMEENEDKKP